MFLNSILLQFHHMLLAYSILKLKVYLQVMVSLCKPFQVRSNLHANTELRITENIHLVHAKKGQKLMYFILEKS